MIIGNERAYPVAASYSDDNPQVLVPVDGLTIRQHFAAILNTDEESFSLDSVKLIMGVDELPTDKLENIKFWDAFTSKRKVMLADALIAELNKNTNQ